jgi:hypothetical protein
MCLRTSSTLGGLALLAACGAKSPAPAGERVECAIGQGADFAADCTLERVEGSQEIVIHNPDGGFRRLRFDAATGSLTPLDGAEPLVLEQVQGMLQFAVGADRYRIERESAASPAP